MTSGQGGAEALPDPGCPVSHGLLLLAARAIGLGPSHHVLDVQTGHGGAALLLARELGCRVTAIDADERRVATVRRSVEALGLQSLVQVSAMDLGHWRLPAGAFDAVLALGGVITALGGVPGLSQIGVYLAPGGHLLLADLVYMDGVPPAAARDLLGSISAESGPVEPVGNAPAPLVRAIFEQGRYRFLNEPEYVELLEALGYEVLFNVLMPESAWGRYFERAARSAGDPESPHHDPEARALVAQEAGAYYGYGGRGTVGYLFAGARQGGV